uniref:Putative hybrid signal transduction histidine kinase m n=1 Tax=Lutzomyia longipalpis TaxID=7200 RepID=A0A1B0CD28_LUTLO
MDNVQVIYRERERDNGHDVDGDQVINQSAYDLELEKDHALPTSAPNADILKSNSNPTYPNPNRHHNQDRHRLQSLPNSTDGDQVINQSAYDLELEKDHALPTSAPNADILKSNSNPTYPNPNRHHNQDRHRLQSLPNSTEFARKGPTMPMFPGDMPSYAPPSRSFFTPPLPPEYQNPFADKPTLRGTNSDLGVIHASGGFHRRPIPPPSLVPGYERIPYRPPDLVPARPEDEMVGAPKPKEEMHMYEIVRKKALNTPSIKTQDTGFVNVTEAGPGTNAPAVGTGVLHFPSISRILSGSNGRKEDIPDILLRTVTVRPAMAPKSPTVTAVTHYQGMNLNKNRDEEPETSTEAQEQRKALNTPSIKTQDTGFVNVTEAGPGTNAPAVGTGVLHFPSISRILSGSNGRKEDIPDILLRTVTVRPAMAPKSPTVTAVTHYQGMNLNKNRDEEPETSTEAQEQREPVSQPKIKEPKTTTPFVTDDDTYSTHRIQKLVNSDATPTTTLTPSVPPVLSADRQSALVTWTIAWNIHVYLSAILYTILAVYSIFKMIFYDKLTHLFSQTYFITIHMILIGICLARIFYLCYDAYNMHSSFTAFVSELLLNLPALMLALTFATLILFLLLRSLNHKANRYSALLRPLTIAVGGGVHIGLCVTLHYVESYGVRAKVAYDRPPPRVLSLICQIIFIFVCLSLGTFYLYIYRVLKRVLRSKSQNYIHGYQNLSYAIHITIATALLFVLMAALQVYGAVSISATQDLDWLQWGYQFSLRLIEIAHYIANFTGQAKVQREKAVEQHISGFALFPCTSSSSQEHFETDYPAVCNANTNLHTYTLRTGKPIYDDNFTVNPVEAKATAAPDDLHCGSAQGKETESVHSADPADHYENPKFELTGSASVGGGVGGGRKEEMFDVCYSEPMQYDFQNLERPTFERPSSRNEFRASKNLKALKGATERRHFNPYNSFDRRAPEDSLAAGVRKSGTLGNIGHYHVNQGRRCEAPGRLAGVQTIQQQRPRYAGRYLQRPQEVQVAQDKSTSANSSDDSVNSGSMLVAEAGFVRFRALDELEQQGVVRDKRLLQS